MSNFTETVVEEAALEWLDDLRYKILHGPEIAAGESAAERDDSGYRDVILAQRLWQALERLNSKLPREAIEDAYKRILRPGGAAAVTRNHAFHKMLVDGVNVEFTRADGSIGGAQVRVIDFDDPENNDWAAVNQFTIIEGQHERRPDVLIFVNGLPLVLMELKNPADENAT
ncbi:MAG: type I restriction endonuclease subunit R, partial [Deltaproteobacteria bacterium]|nr:type I restriction endonuclease subunit R [Deltaproteobacteria bacterium]